MRRMPALAAATAIMTILVASCGVAEKAESAPTSTAPPTPPLQAAAQTCNLPDAAVGDGGKTLILDGAGKDDKNYVDGEWTTTEGTLPIEDIGCALRTVGAPDSVVSMMEGTRAIDGRQSQDAGDYTYSWSYHPDSGLDIIITENS
ncbi:hypothetical protein Bra3105_17915 [Brachybacterium halotolerans subsp. kimchii]|uniref:hypothetical protein n=1 Tax=Brachybacterium halotolerans TaxID=2795215 RepID=UPI001E4E92CE|nr:hypothetical protein [Brachybacterium halotolerans]UEJ82679.1 hypothetical protein Bra3105_17915 [Brachybacterium halotolerans subsp. kimchii]